MHIVQQVVSQIEDYWFESVDARAYAVLRIGYGLSSLVHLIFFWPLKREFFSAAGMFPQNNMFGGDAIATDYLFFLIAVVIIAQIIGLSPRLTSTLVFLWHCSYSLLQPYEGLVRGLGLIVACSPCIDTWSLSSALRKNSAAVPLIPPHAPAYGLKLLRWQLIFLFANLSWSLFGDPHVIDGTFASYYLISLSSRFAHPLPVFMEFASVIITFAFLGSALFVPFFLSTKQTFRLGIILTVFWSVVALLVSQWSIFLIYLFPTYLTLGLAAARRE